MDNCSVGIFTQSHSHKPSFTKNLRLISLDTLATEDKYLLSLCTEHSEQELVSLCFHLRIVYLEKYDLKQTHCKPFQKHQKQIKGSLRKVTIAQCKNWLRKAMNLKPGKKICMKLPNASQDGYFGSISEGIIGRCF